LATFSWDSGKGGFPQCHGIERFYNPVSQECRQCQFQNSCRDRIATVKAMPLAQPARLPILQVQNQQPPWVSQPAQAQVPAQPVFQNNFARNPYMQPQQVQPQYPSPPGYNYPGYVNQNQVPNPYQFQQQQPPQQYYVYQPVPPPPAPNQPHWHGEVYGRFNDPLYAAMAANPVPMRTQMSGETFTNRFAKNAFLAVCETFLGEAMVAVRQAVLPPKDPSNGSGKGS